MQARVATGNIFLDCFIFDPHGHKLREAHDIVTPFCKTFAVRYAFVLIMAIYSFSIS